MAATSQPGTPPFAQVDDELRKLSIDTIRGLAMDAVQKANSGHPGTAMALAPLAYTIFRRFLRANPHDTDWPDRDRFVLSSGHACVLQYSLLHLCGYDALARGPRSSSASGARARPGHPERGHTPGIEVTTGPLGQGFANAVGMAIAERFLAERFNRPGQRDRRPPRLRDLLGRRHDGGDQPGSRLDRGPLRARQAGRLLRRQPHHDRRHDVDLLRRREPRRALRGATAGTCSASRTPRTSTRSTRAISRRARGNRAAVVHRDPLAHRLPGAATRSTPPSRTARRSARTRCARPRRSMGFDPDRNFWVDERVYEHMSLSDSGAAAQGEWRERFDAVARELSRHGRRLGSRLARASCATAGARRCRASRRARRSRRARPGRR